MRAYIYIIIVLFLLNGFDSFGKMNNDDSASQVQTKEYKWVDSIKVYKAVDINAKFKGNFNSFFIANIEYPKKEDDEIINSSAQIQFIVHPDGRISHIKAIGRHPTSTLSKEMMRIIELSNGLWEPAYIDGEPVASFFVQPITVCLQ